MSVVCKKCGESFEPLKGFKNYCSNKCRNGRVHTENTKKKISYGLLTSDKHRKKVEKEVEKYKDLHTKKCIICNIEFYNKTRVTCSDNCKNLSISLKRQDYIKNNGVFSTPRETFLYKGITINVDSNLEKAAIIYLTDILSVKNISRYEKLINYKINNQNKTFNPDFICTLDNKTTIVEVKMKWYNNSEHKYSITIPFKKNALEKFCQEKNYKCIWLDFDYDKKFRNIYYTFMKSK